MSTIVERPPVQPPEHKTPWVRLVVIVSAVAVVIAAIVTAVMLTAGGGKSKPAGLSNVASHHGITAVITGQRFGNGQVDATVRLTNSTGAAVRNMKLGIACQEKSGTGSVKVSGTVTFSSAVQQGVSTKHIQLPLLVQNNPKVTGWHLRIVSP